MTKEIDLKVGDWVKVLDWVGRIDDIATSGIGTIMIKITSFKGIWNHHASEWLEYKPEYAPGAIVKATNEQIIADYMRFSTHAQICANDIYKLVKGAFV